MIVAYSYYHKLSCGGEALRRRALPGASYCLDVWAPEVQLTTTV